jgi:hypothetical protein
MNQLLFQITITTIIISKDILKILVLKEFEERGRKHSIIVIIIIIFMDLVMLGLFCVIEEYVGSSTVTVGALCPF